MTYFPLPWLRFHRRAIDRSSGPRRRPARILAAPRACRRILWPFCCSRLPRRASLPSRPSALIVANRCSWSRCSAVAIRGYCNRHKGQ
eukprot:6978621-Prymnesium_polylepis.1